MEPSSGHIRCVDRLSRARRTRIILPGTGRSGRAGQHAARQTCVSGKKKTNKHKHFRQDDVRDKQEPFLGQMGPLPGTKWDPSLGQTGLSRFSSTVKSPCCPVCPWDGWGFVPGTIVPQGPSEKCLCVFCLLFFLLPSVLWPLPHPNWVSPT